jgi:rRNA maturation RNase YbeY
MIVAYVNRQRKTPVEWLTAITEQVVQAVWSSHATALMWKNQGYEAGVTVHYVSAARIRGINRETRGIDCVTDVLSFPLLEMVNGRMTRKIRPEDLDRGKSAWPIVWLGDVVLCPAVAERQAIEYGHSKARETAFLSVHGMLHLMGYDHIDRKGEKAMLEIQEHILSLNGFQRDTPEGA